MFWVSSYVTRYPFCHFEYVTETDIMCFSQIFLFILTKYKGTLSFSRRPIAYWTRKNYFWLCFADFEWDEYRWWQWICRRKGKLHLCSVSGCLFQPIHVLPLPPHLLWALLTDSCQRQSCKHSLPIVSDNYFQSLFPDR